MLNSLMYKLSYYRFDEMQTSYGQPKVSPLSYHFPRGTTPSGSMSWATRTSSSSTSKKPTRPKIGSFAFSEKNKDIIGNQIIHTILPPSDGLMYTSKLTTAYVANSEERKKSEVVAENKYAVKASAKKRK